MSAGASRSQPTPDSGPFDPREVGGEKPGSEVSLDKPGALTQYSRIGPGWAPCSSTQEKLPPGLYRLSAAGDVWFFEPHTFVTDSLLRLPDSKSDMVIDEIRKFWTLKDKFVRLGYTHKRGVLLWGPPGSGKTSTIAIIVKDMIAAGGIVVIGDVHPEVTAQMLARLRQVEPERPVVVILEDLDALVRRYGEANLLAILDGEKSINNVVYIASTNYPEMLDPRITNRPSRFDRVVQIAMPSYEARKMYLASRSVVPEEQLDAWAAATDGLSIAHLKELLVGVYIFEGELDDEVKRLKGMGVMPNSEKGDNSRRAGFELTDPDDEKAYSKKAGFGR